MTMQERFTPRYRGKRYSPEASISAQVFHHPNCAYFTAGEDSEPALAS